MPRRIVERVNLGLEKWLPERRMFLRTDTETRFVRLRPLHQLAAFGGIAGLITWSIISGSIMLMDNLGAGSLRERAAQEQTLFQERLDALASERDLRHQEAQAAQERFNVALTEVSRMQSEILGLYEQKRELDAAIKAMRQSLADTMQERDNALADTHRVRDELALLTSGDAPRVTEAEELSDTLSFMTSALAQTATERDTLIQITNQATAQVAALEHNRKLNAERTDRIFQQLEEALLVSVDPLDKMFSKAGLSTETMLNQVRSGYGGLGGPLTPISLSTKGEPQDPDQIRANAILGKLDTLNLYRLAAEKAPFDVPVKSSFRFTSGFGQRWGRMHQGTDFAAAYGTPITATADGVVVHAGWGSGYGRLVKIQHDFGIETRYAHLAKIRVKVGQRVSRGDRIGDMGNSGRSTGTHLHYEVRVNGKPVNPMTYIKAARDVF